MQLALAAGSTPDRGTVSDFLPTSRTNLVLAAGVALAAAGVLAINPVAPIISLDAHQSDVQLANTTAENWANLMDVISGPNPVGTAASELFGHYGDVAKTSLEASMEGVQGIWSGHGAALGLEALLPLVSQYMQDGNTTEAFNLVNKEMLFDMQNVFQPLFNHIPRGETDEVAGIFGLSSTMLRDWANVQDVFGDYNTWKGMAEAMMSPSISAMYALSDQFTNTGDHTPQDVLDAFLNGYIPWDPQAGSDTVHAPLVGFLTEEGPIDYMFRILPEMIANAMTMNLPVDDVVVPVDPDLGDALAGANLFDFDWVNGLFA
ncbi:hypothetical protein [[Mycobacterium] crassicus]|uniref:PE-PGRS family protein n=1 Tax=[Mycobacterium] crassicus TaxID=2872309 RepID=A0ABU5XEV5_9MYCO|nr:hypothetical protein [Mycolicibacter sp. MYC098]MEB3020713.1 hypothetical protein [Mycolicibacter sp. MYC098]